MDYKVEIAKIDDLDSIHKLIYDRYLGSSTTNVNINQDCCIISNNHTLEGLINA